MLCGWSMTQHPVLLSVLPFVRILRCCGISFLWAWSQKAWCCLLASCLFFWCFILFLRQGLMCPRPLSDCSWTDCIAAGDLRLLVLLPVLPYKWGYECVSCTHLVQCWNWTQGFMHARYTVPTELAPSPLLYCTNWAIPVALFSVLAELVLTI